MFPAEWLQNLSKPHEIPQINAMKSRIQCKYPSGMVATPIQTARMSVPDRIKRPGIWKTIIIEHPDKTTKIQQDITAKAVARTRMGSILQTDVAGQIMDVQEHHERLLDEQPPRGHYLKQDKR